jgi:outer membrane murein-binding lipoprotein Lpp
MDFKAMALTATLGGTVLLSGLTFTGALDLTDIKGFGSEWANKITLAVNETKAMSEKFNLFKGDAQTQINAKIAKVNELNAKISELVAKVGNGEMDLEKANSEIARLNEQLEQANTEIAALKNEFASKDTEVQTAFAEMATAESLDTTLTLDTQNADTIIPEAPEAPSEPEQTPEPPVEPQNEFEAQETAIYNAIQGSNPVTNLVVTVTATTVNITGDSLQGAGFYDTAIESGLGRSVMYNGTYSTTTLTYNIQ